MEKVSVIIPTHNRADVLGRAIESVQKQSFPIHEIIVVSDGSTDNTDSVMEVIKKNDKRIKYISYHPGKNGNYARNRGISEATGDYIAFLDDDDEWLTDKTKKQIDVFRSDPDIGLVYCGQNCIYEDIGVTYQTKPSWKGDLSGRIFVHNDIGTTSQVMIRRKLLSQTGEFDLRLEALQDYDLWIRFCLISKIGFVYEPCINYYNAAGKKQVSGSTEKYIRSVKYILNKYKKQISQLDSDLQKSIFSCKKMNVGKRCLRNGDGGKKARYYFREAWKIKPSREIFALFFASFVPYKIVLKVRGHFKY